MLRSVHTARQHKSYTYSPRIGVYGPSLQLQVWCFPKMTYCYFSRDNIQTASRCRLPLPPFPASSAGPCIRWWNLHTIWGSPAPNYGCLRLTITAFALTESIHGWVKWVSLVCGPGKEPAYGTQHAIPPSYTAGRTQASPACCEKTKPQ